MHANTLHISTRSRMLYDSGTVYAFTLHNTEQEWVNPLYSDLHIHMKYYNAKRYLCIQLQPNLNENNC